MSKAVCLKPRVVDIKQLHYDASYDILKSMIERSRRTLNYRESLYTVTFFDASIENASINTISLI